MSYEISSTFQKSKKIYPEENLSLSILADNSNCAIFAKLERKSEKTTSVQGLRATIFLSLG